MPSTTIVSRIPAIFARQTEAVVNEINVTATAIEQGIKDPESPSRAPYRTGNLRRSYHVDRATVEKPEAQVGNDMKVAEYAGYVEFGTGRMAAQPHLRPSTERQRAPHVARVMAALRAATRLP